MNKPVTDWIRPEVLALSAYHVPPARQMIKLDAMENPYQWEAAHVQAWLQTLSHAPLNRYPDPTAATVQAELRRVMQIPSAFPIILGNGSDELIQMLILALNAPGHTVLAPEPSFVMYRMLAQIVGMNYVGVPLNSETFALELPTVLAAIEQHQPALTFLAYPNNPTGNLFSAADIQAIIATSPGVVVLDEAYAPFTEASFLSHLGQYPNLLVMRTVSKLGLAGLRLGLLTGPSDWLEQIEKTRLPYNINVLTQLSAVYALQHYAMLSEQTAAIRADRAELIAALRNLPGIQRVWDSEANFILFRVPQARQVFEQLRSDGILIKCLDGSHPLLKDCLRVTVGTSAENAAFLAALQRQHVA
jgi:histidinol-phosphate aminotransferase